MHQQLGKCIQQSGKYDYNLKETINLYMFLMVIYMREMCIKIQRCVFHVSQYSYCVFDLYRMLPPPSISTYINLSQL